MTDRFAQTGRTTRMLFGVVDYALTTSCSDCIVICGDMKQAEIISDMLAGMFPKSLKRSNRVYFRLPNDSCIVFISQHHSRNVVIGKHYDYVVKDHAVSEST